MLPPFIYIHMLLFFFKEMYLKKINQLICLIESVWGFLEGGVQLHNSASFSCSARFGVKNDHFSKTINSLSGPLVELFVIAEAKNMLK